MTPGPHFSRGLPSGGYLAEVCNGEAHARQLLPDGLGQAEAQGAPGADGDAQQHACAFRAQRWEGLGGVGQPSHLTRREGISPGALAPSDPRHPNSRGLLKQLLFQIPCGFSTQGPVSDPPPLSSISHGLPPDPATLP